MSSRRIHATTVSLRGHGVVIVGPSGTGKSDLALRLIDRGARLVSDDQTLLSVEAGRVMASPPATIAGKMEVRGIGIVDMPHLASAPVALVVELSAEVERMPPESIVYSLAGADIPLAKIDARAASAPILVEIALARVTGDTP